jgi:hypothetical protein
LVTKNQCQIKSIILPLTCDEVVFRESDPNAGGAVDAADGDAPRRCFSTCPLTAFFKAQIGLREIKF